MRGFIRILIYRICALVRFVIVAEKFEFEPANLNVRQHPAKTGVFNITTYLERFIDLCSLTSQNGVSTCRRNRTGSMQVIHVIHAGLDGISYLTLRHPSTSTIKQPNLIPNKKRKIFFSFPYFYYGEDLTTMY